MNPETLHFYFDRKLNTLFVHGSDPLVVENKALGYTLHYILDRFELDFMTGHLVVKGIPRFEEIPFVSRKDSTSRVKKRKVAYHGPLNHFMRSLANSLAS